MKNLKIMIYIAAALMIVSCNAQNSKQAEVKESLPAEPAAQSTAPATAPEAAANVGKAGMVVETMNSGGYTYVLIENDEGQFWAAGPETEVEKGAAVAVPAGSLRLWNFMVPRLLCEPAFEQVAGSDP